MLGALAVTVGVTAYLAWPARRSASTRQRQALIAYLRDHLTASDVPFVSCIVSWEAPGYRGWDVVPSTVQSVRRGPRGPSNTAVPARSVRARSSELRVTRPVPY